MIDHVSRAKRLRCHGSGTRLRIPTPELLVRSAAHRTRIALPAASGPASRTAGPYFPEMEDCRFRERLFLAPASRLQAIYRSQVECRFLASEISREHASRCGQLQSPQGFGMAGGSPVAMRDRPTRNCRARHGPIKGQISVIAVSPTHAADAGLGARGTHAAHCLTFGP